MNFELENTICLHPETETRLRTWLERRPTPAFLCVGPPGIGKTTLVYRVCQLAGYLTKELNASHTRTGSAFRDIIVPLLENKGVSMWVSKKYTQGHVVILDEMDGLSQGERGGLQELLKFLRDNKKGGCPVPLILICNEVQGRKMQQILRLCEVCDIQKPGKGVLEEWLGRPIQDAEATADLRQLLRGDDMRGLARETTRGSILGAGASAVATTTTAAAVAGEDDLDDTPETYTAAWYSLYDRWGLEAELDLETKDANLAGLLFHQNLPRRLQGCGGWKDYRVIHNMFADSDLSDYWAFFHQCWVLLQISNNMKLKYPNQYLQTVPFEGEPPAVMDLEYTWVLTKQSALFNTWKEMLRLVEMSGTSVRLLSDYVITVPPNRYSAAIKLD
jgi:hypothetical protein